MKALEAHRLRIEQAPESIETLNQAERDSLLEAAESIVFALDEGKIRVATIEDDGTTFKVQTHAWIKRAILLYFQKCQMQAISINGQQGFDKIMGKFERQGQSIEKSGIRVVPGAIVRVGAHIQAGAILMPSFVNIGAYVGAGTMVDTWATIGSCAQIGQNVHISGGAGIGGVLEPLVANPVVIGDHVFVGARSEIAEGVIVEPNSVIGMGVMLGSSTRIYDRVRDEIYYGRVPRGSVVVSGTLPDSTGKVQLYAAIIVKQIDAKTRAKTSINQLLRD